MMAMEVVTLDEFRAAVRAAILQHAELPMCCLRVLDETSDDDLGYYSFQSLGDVVALVRVFDDLERNGYQTARTGLAEAVRLTHGSRVTPAYWTDGTATGIAMRAADKGRTDSLISMVQGDRRDALVMDRAARVARR